MILIRGKIKLQKLAGSWWRYEFRIFLSLSSRFILFYCFHVVNVAASRWLVLVDTTTLFVLTEIGVDAEGGYASHQWHHKIHLIDRMVCWIFKLIPWVTCCAAIPATQCCDKAFPLFMNCWFQSWKIKITLTGNSCCQWDDVTQYSHLLKHIYF